MIDEEEVNEIRDFYQNKLDIAIDLLILAKRELFQFYHREKDCQFLIEVNEFLKENTEQNG